MSAAHQLLSCIDRPPSRASVTITPAQLCAERARIQLTDKWGSTSIFTTHKSHNLNARCIHIKRMRFSVDVLSGRVVCVDRFLSRNTAIAGSAVDTAALSSLLLCNSCGSDDGNKKGGSSRRSVGANGLSKPTSFAER